VRQAAVLRDPENEQFDIDWFELRLTADARANQQTKREQPEVAGDTGVR
jgi:hypothetical protein